MSTKSCSSMASTQVCLTLALPTSIVCKLVLADKVRVYSLANCSYTNCLFANSVREWQSAIGKSPPFPHHMQIAYHVVYRTSK